LAGGQLTLSCHQTSDGYMPWNNLLAVQGQLRMGIKLVNAALRVDCEGGMFAKKGLAI